MVVVEKIHRKEDQGQVVVFQSYVMETSTFLSSLQLLLILDRIRKQLFF